MLIRLPLALVLVLGVADTNAQSAWTPLAGGAGVPGARAEHVLIGDLARGGLVLFGGRDSAGTLLADTWTWDGLGWTQRSPSRSPGPRRAVAAAWDHVRGLVVLFGGYDAAGLALDELWSWDGNDWTLAAPVPGTGPTARAAATLAGGPGDGRLVLFGGVDALGVVLAETWSWDGAAWTRRTPTSSPSPRFGARAAPDLLRRRALLYGGHAAGGGGAETWEWDGSVWRLRQLASPPGIRTRHALAFDASRARVVIHGGTDGVTYAFADSWEWDGGSWQRLNSAVIPTAVVDAAMGYDAARASLVRFGGFDGIASNAAMWSLGSVNPAEAIPYGVGCAGTAGVPQLTLREFEGPWLGDTFTQVASRLPATAPMAFQVGFSRTLWAGQSLPLPLDPIGMTGCSVYVSIDAVGVVVAAAGRATLGLTVPFDPVIVGARLFGQCVVIDPGANPAGVTLSSALEFRIGRR